MVNCVKKKILIVDDEVLVLKKLKKILTSITDEIKTAINGKEALDIILNENDIVCVICDIRMPVMNGIEAIKNVRESGLEIPFIFFTGHGNNELLKEAARYGAFDFVHKPSFENLEDSIQRGINYGFKLLGNNAIDIDLMSDFQKLASKMS